MENFVDGYWETNMLLRSEELNSCYLEEGAMSGYYDSSSPDGTTASKNIVSERMRRKKLNEKLYALRSVVPNITKMDKASIIEDAIQYIQSLHDEERKIQAEISELESGQASYEAPNFYYDNDNPDNYPVTYNNWSDKSTKRTRVGPSGCDLAGSGSVVPSPIQVLELSVFNMEKKITVVSLTCSKSSDTMARLCELFESLKLKIITANIVTFSGKLMKTVFLEADEEEKEALRIKIEDAIATMNGHMTMSPY